jgi:hypothetical protein
VTHLPPLVAYDLAIGIVTSAILGYFLYDRRAHLRYRPSILVAFAGIFVFVLGDPLIQLFHLPAIHIVHGIAALLIAYGLYDPVQHRFRETEWSSFFLRDPRAVRSNLDWMTPMDDDILQTLDGSALVLTPSIIAHNIDRSREAVSRRLAELSKREFVERVDHGKYEITPIGRQYLGGELPTRRSTSSNASKSTGDD